MSNNTPTICEGYDWINGFAKPCTCEATGEGCVSGLSLCAKHLDDEAQDSIDAVYEIED
jgi:hypothetical protein